MAAPRRGGSGNDVRIQWSFGTADTRRRYLGGDQYRSELRFQRKEIALDTGGGAPAAAGPHSVVFHGTTGRAGIGFELPRSVCSVARMRLVAPVGSGDHIAASAPRTWARR